MNSTKRLPGETFFLLHRTMPDRFHRLKEYVSQLENELAKK
jgi:hypothetical protein